MKMITIIIQHDNDVNDADDVDDDDKDDDYEYFKGSESLLFKKTKLPPSMR